MDNLVTFNNAAVDV